MGSVMGLVGREGFRVRLPSGAELSSCANAWAIGSPTNASKSEAACFEPKKSLPGLTVLAVDLARIPVEIGAIYRMNDNSPGRVFSLSTWKPT